MNEYERKRFLESQQAYKENNQKFAFYITLAFLKFPYTWFEYSDRPGRYRRSEKINLDNSIITSIQLFNDDGWPFFTNKNKFLAHRYGVMVNYNPYSPENIIEYRDIDDNVRIAKRIHSRFGFSWGGGAECAHFIPDKFVNGKHIDGHNSLSFYGENKDNYFTPLPFDDEEFRSKIVKVERKPTTYQRSGGYLIDLECDDIGWMEFVGNLLQTLSNQYPKLYNFSRFGSTWRPYYQRISELKAI